MADMERFLSWGNSILNDRGRKTDYKRKRPSIERRQTFYIICEGTKTEYSYLKAIRRERRLRSVQIDIDPGSRSGSDPKNLIEYARFKRLNEDYDEVWCVFDDDGRNYLDDVFTAARKKPELHVAFSNPCFELWYFLHYEYSTKSCDQNVMVERLKKHIPDYSKEKMIYGILPDCENAFKRADDLRNYHVICGNKEIDNPSTNIDRLIIALYSLEDK